MPTPGGTTIPGETGSPSLAATETAATDTTETAATPDTTATLDTPATPTAATDTTQTPNVPVTGADVILLECQFCIEGMAHALLVLPETATFETVADTASLSTPGPDTGCNTVDTFNGRQVVLCRSEENTSLNLNICTDGNNCTRLLVELQSCTDTNQPGATNTPGAAVPTNTPQNAGSPISLPSPTPTP